MSVRNGRINTTTKMIKTRAIILIFIVIIGVLIAFPTYYFISINQPFFWDLIIIFLTIVCYFIFYKTKFKYVALLLLLGLNILIVGQKIDTTELKILNEICFAVGTGLIATGIGNILIICENNKRIKIERLKEIDDINLYIENVVENLFYDISKRPVAQNNQRCQDILQLFPLGQSHGKRNLYTASVKHCWFSFPICINISV